LNEAERMLLNAICRRAEHKAVRLAGEFVRCQPGDREAVLAPLEFEQWLAESCRDCQASVEPSSQARL